MTFVNKAGRYTLALLAAGIAVAGCQKMDRPGLPDFPQDANPPGGPLNFYAAFDGTTSDSRMNAVDSVRVNFPADNPLAAIDGVSGKAVQGENKKFIKYAKPNDWAAKAKSFSVAFWYKKDGQTKNNTLGNGPEYIMSFPSSNGHWSGASMFIMMEGNNAQGEVKVMTVDKTNADNWFTWERSNNLTIPNLFDNQWHHMALVYDATTSGMTLYLDGVANPNVRTWANHGDINIDDSKISEMRIGAGPGKGLDTDDWLSSTFKGAIDQYRMYSSALTAAEVNALFTQKK
ncbi:LamG domain-containing protein [Paracnuella aquatica]|uniref:LamG domain-containing protein n=1 Tax=Paracnuella aquatica TaxID=2268757 RepID=UPI000DEFAC42|nr:LamG domain-containing protein [Paracnuella aquatica]RPD44397.1 LamG domain-containing protein [Paracnuella aquatica]